MKRSEMVDHIKEDLLAKLDHYLMSKSKDLWCEHTANELLDMIEGFGMQPPERLCDGASGRYIEEYENTWEPEA